MKSLFNSALVSTYIICNFSVIEKRPNGWVCFEIQRPPCNEDNLKVYINIPDLVWWSPARGTSENSSLLCHRFSSENNRCVPQALLTSPEICCQIVASSSFSIKCMCCGKQKKWISACLNCLFCLQIVSFYSVRTIDFGLSIERVWDKKKWLLIKMKQFCDPGKMKHPNCQFHLKHTSRTNIASLRFSTGNSRFNSSVKINSTKENTTYSLNPCDTHL